MSKQNLTELFKGQFIGMEDMNGKPTHEGDSVDCELKDNEHKMRVGMRNDAAEMMEASGLNKHPSRQNIKLV